MFALVSDPRYSWLHSDCGWLLGDLKASPFTNASSLLRSAGQGRGGNKLLGCIQQFSGITVFPVNGEVCRAVSEVGRDAMNSSIQKPRMHQVLVSYWVKMSARPWILMPHFSPVWWHLFPPLCFCSWHLDEYSCSVLDLWNHIFQAGSSFLMFPLLSFWNNFTHISARFMGI